MIFRKAADGEAVTDEWKYQANIRRLSGWEMVDEKRL
jgi:hypothetical protein